MSQVRRNDPCPCGSGRKYKQCCQQGKEEAERTQRQARQTAQAGIPALVAAGIAAYRQGDTQLARQKYEQILAISPDDPDGLHLLGVLHRDAGDLEAAVTLIRRAIDTLPGEAMFHNNLGIAYRRQGKLNEACTAYRAALERAPRHVETLNNLGNVLSELGDYPRALDCFRQAREIAPAFAQASFNLGHTLQTLEEHAAAIDAYRDALAAQPDYVDALSNLGMVLHALDRDEEALAAFEAAIELDNQHQAAYMNIGCLLLDRAQSAQGLPFLEHACRLRPEHAPTLNELGQAYKTLGHPAAADLSRAAVSLAADTDAGHAAAVRLALLAYLDTEDAMARQWLAQAKNVRHGKLKTVRAYWIYLSHLLDWQEKYRTPAPPAELPAFHIIGDSHILALRQLTIPQQDAHYRTQLHWVEGCKQWHLGQPENNDYQEQFLRHCHTLTAGTHLLVCVGEIDCRLEEGILKAWRTHPEQSLDALIENTQAACLSFLQELARTLTLRLTICGVPAINKRALAGPSTARDQQAALIVQFNQRLAPAARQHGFGYLDTFGLTHESHGYSSGKWHLDEVHLTPAAYTEAFKNFWLAPQTP